MDTPELEGVLRRLDRLERENRYLRRVAVSVVVAAGLLAVAGAELSRGPRVVEAERFVVRDAAGKERASLGIKGDMCLLVLQDPAGKHLASVNVTGQGAMMLAMQGEVGDAAAGLSLSADAGPALFLNDRGGASKAMLTPQLCTFADPAGKVRAAINVGPDGTPRVTLADQKGHSRASLTLVDDEGTPSLGLADKDGKTRVSLTASDRLPSQIRVMDPSGKTLFRAPAK